MPAAACGCVADERYRHRAASINPGFFHHRTLFLFNIDQSCRIVSIDQLLLDPERRGDVAIHYYGGGHMMYLLAEERRRQSDKLKAFIRSCLGSRCSPAGKED